MVNVYKTGWAKRSEFSRAKTYVQREEETMGEGHFIPLFLEHLLDGIKYAMGMKK